MAWTRLRLCLGRGGSDRLDLLRLGALGALGDLETHPLVLIQRTVSAGLDRRVVDEHVRATTVGRDEPESLFRVEPLDGSLSHCFFSSVLPTGGLPCPYRV